MDEDLFFSVDCETSGPFPGRHALLSVGVVVVRRNEGCWRLGDTFYREWAPPPYAEEDPAATAIHKLDLRVLGALGVSADEGTRGLAEWVTAQSAGRRIFVGYNAAFDWAFVLHAFGAARLANPFHHAPLDLKSAIWGVHGGAWRTGSNTEALERVIGKQLLTESDVRQHHALDDATRQAGVLIALLKHFEERGSGASP